MASSISRVLMTQAPPRRFWRSAADRSRRVGAAKGSLRRSDVCDRPLRPIISLSDANYLLKLADRLTYQRRS